MCNECYVKIVAVVSFSYVRWSTGGGGLNIQHVWRLPIVCHHTRASPKSRLLSNHINFSLALTTA